MRRGDARARRDDGYERAVDARRWLLLVRCAARLDPVRSEDERGADRIWQVAGCWMQDGRGDQPIGQLGGLTQRAGLTARVSRHISAAAEGSLKLGGWAIVGVVSSRCFM